MKEHINQHVADLTGYCNVGNRKYISQYPYESGLLFFLF